MRQTDKPLALLGSLHWDIFNEWRARLRSDLLLHGCAVGKGEKALLFIGTRHTGKTTLSTYLIQGGYCYLTDDFVLIDPQTLRLRPLPGPIRVKTPVFPYDRTRLTLYTCRSGPIYYAVPQPEAIAPQERSFVIQALIFPEYAPEGTISLQLLSRGRAAYELMSHSYNQPLLRAWGFEIITRLAETVPGYRLRHGELEPTRLLLENLFTSS